MPAMTSLRELLASVLLLAAAVLGVLWLPAAWIAEHVVDEDGFLALTQPLADDPDFRATLTDQAVDALLEKGHVPGWIAERVEPVAREQAQQLAATDASDEIWRAAMVEVHTAILTPGADDIVVDLAPAADALLARVEEAVPLLDLDAPASLPVTIAQMPASPLLEGAVRLAPWAGRIGAAALVCAVLALLVAGHRRAALIGAGVAAVLAGAAVWVLGAQITVLVPDRLDQAAFLGPLLQVLEARFTADLEPQALVMAGAGAGAIVLGAVALAVLPRRRRG